MIDCNYCLLGKTLSNCEPLLRTLLNYKWKLKTSCNFITLVNGIQKLKYCFICLKEETNTSITDQIIRLALNWPQFDERKVEDIPFCRVYGVDLVTLLRLVD